MARRGTGGRNTGVRYEIPSKGIVVSTPLSQETWQGAGMGKNIRASKDACVYSERHMNGTSQHDMGQGT